MAGASTSRETTAAPRALRTNALTPASTIVVNSTSDAGNGSDGLCTLPEAINAANTDAASGATAGECVAGSGDDTIDLTGVTGTIILTSGLPFITSDITINGPGANQLTIARSTADSTPRFRIFTILTNLTVNISGLRITNGHVLDGVNGAQGGGISTSLGTTVNLTNMVIEGNITGNGAPGSGGFGGGVFNAGTMDITNSTITGNRTGTGGSDPGAFGGYGGGIHNAGTLTLTNTTVSGNTTGISASPTQGGYGGGIYNIINRTVTLINCTISDNQAGTGGLGGGIRNEGTVNLKDTIVANNAVNGSGTGPDLSGSFDSQDFNLIESVSGASFTGVTTHNITGVDPLLGPLGAYGGTTLTHPLLFGSPAIDAGNTSQTTDQRAQPRPIDDLTVTNAAGGNGTDIGAFEAHNLQVNNMLDTDDGSCTSLGTGNGCSLREAINAANAQIGMESISFASALNNSPAPLMLTTALPAINTHLIISGPGANLLTISRHTAGGTPHFRIFTVASMMTVSISGLTLTNGRTADGVQPAAGSFGNPGDHGGGIMNSGVLTLTNMTITGNRTGNGSLPAASSSGSNFGGPGGFGGGIYSSGQLTMSNVTVSNNTTGNGVSAIFGGGGGRGGGIFILSGSLTMTNCMVSGNVTGIGAISTNGSSSGSGGGGGGIYIQVGTTTITNTSVINNTTGTTQVASPSNSGSGGEGGGITIDSGTSVDSGNITIVNSTISGNRTGDGTGFAGQAGRGAGLNNGSSNNLTIVGTTISGNQTGNGLNTGEAGIGAGLSNTATTKIINSTISGNITGGGNIGGGHGAGIWNAKNLFLTNSTVVLNTNGGSSGPGIHQFNSSSAVTLRNTIIAGNTIPGQPNAADLSGGPAYNSQGNNLIGNADGASGFSVANGDQLGTMATPLNPRLAPLGNYGGPTKTHALLPGSPALEAGNNCVNNAAHCSDANIPQLTTDQRGINRLVNSTVDISAFESRGFTFSATSGSPQSTVIGSTFAQPLVATVSSAFAEPVEGALITFAAPVSGASGTFSSGGTTVAVSANSSGVATSPTFIANRTAGSYNVVASLGAGSPSVNFALTNSQAPTTISVFSSVNPSEFGQTVTFTAAVGSNVDVPTGTVQFKDGLNNLGSPVNCAILPPNACSAEFSTSTLSAGNHSISATYSGDANFLSSSGTLSGEQVVKVQPTLSINDASITEGNSSTVDLTFTVTLSAASNLIVNVSYTTANGTATVADDYQLKSGAVTFNPGDPLSKTITVSVIGDQKTEPDETVFVVLSNPVNAAFSDSQGTGTILNDDNLLLLLDTSGPAADQLAALDSLLLTRDPFRVLNQAPWLSSEQNTRVILFAANLNSAESPSVVKVMLLDGSGTHEVPADDVRAMEGTAFTQVTFRLPDGLAQGTCLVSIKAHDRISNTGTFRIIP